MRYRHSYLALVSAAALLLAGCSDSGDRAVNAVVIGEPASPFQTGVRLPPAAQLIRSATTEGLVGFDEQGRVVPALADRWIVTDDGQSYIFRLRDGTWPGGGTITGDSAKAALQRAITGLKGTPLGLDLAPIDEIRAMAGRVIEIRLAQPMPDFLQLLAQPELGLPYRGRGAGPMRLTRDGQTAVLRPIRPEDRGLPMIEGWSERARDVRLAALPAAKAIEAFGTGAADVVMGGRIEDFPRLDIFGLSRGAIRLDPVTGLFGLAVVHADGLLADPANREALALAIDREALINAFGVGGWTATTRIVSPGAEDDSGAIAERWPGQTIAQRREVAAQRIAAWRTAEGDPAPLRIALPKGPGGDILFTRLRDDFAAIGLVAARVDIGAPADLRLIDVMARYPRASWFLNQLSCANARGLCSSAADLRTARARTEPDPAIRADLLADAEAALTRANSFIPFGTPIRWSLLSGRQSGFAPNRWGVHPLMPLAMRPR